MKVSLTPEDVCWLLQTHPVMQSLVRKRKAKSAEVTIDDPEMNMREGIDVELSPPMERKGES